MEKRKPIYIQAIVPFIAMLLFICIGYVMLQLRIELMLSLAAMVAGIVAWKLGYTWEDMEEAIAVILKKITPAVLIMWAVGIVIGTFMFSGSIPLIIYYGLKIVEPQFLIPFTFIICLILASVTGTAWGATGTAGVAMIGLAVGLNVPIPMVAGAAISGAIFGDKMSPLSDTTNLCPASTGGVTLYEHIRHMWYTALPAAIISLILYFGVGMLLVDTSDAQTLKASDAMVETLEKMYQFDGINAFIMLIPLLIVFVGAMLKKPTVPTMLIGSIVAILIGVYCNDFTLANGSNAAIKGFSVDLINMSVEDVDANIVTLVTRGGMFGMIGIITIVYTGYAFTSIWNLTGGIAMMFDPLISRIKTRGQAIASGVVFTTILDGACGTSYVPAIIVPELLRKKYIELGLKLNNLSRILEDAGTCLNPIWPWSMSGIFYATAFGIATFEYVPWAFLCFITPIISLLLGITGFGIETLKKEEQIKEMQRIESEE